VSNLHRITIARGDGIGPEIMDATLLVLKAAGAPIEIEEITIGKQAYLAGQPTGIAPEAWDSLRRTRVFLKAPVTTPQGGGYKSVNVTIRKSLGLYANIRPCVSYHPFVATKHPVMDAVVVRENEEDTYGGIEHRQTAQVTQCLKLITRPGCEKICRYAFEYARANKRRKVTCITKDNIMKLTDGLFHKIFNEIAVDYPDIANEHLIVDFGMAKLASNPETFDVLVLPNLYGDIISDIGAQIAGSVGLAGSANIGENFAMFEAIHGSAPDIAGRGIANPSGLLLASVMMMVHVGHAASAEGIHNAWLRTIEDGIHTGDIYTAEHSHKRVGTREFADAVVARLGQRPQQLRAVSYGSAPPMAAFPLPLNTVARPAKSTVGIDVFIDWEGSAPEQLAERLQPAQTESMRLGMITNRGVKVWPDGFPETFCTDHWRCRFHSHPANSPLTHRQIVELLGRLEAAGIDFIKTEHLCTFDGQPGFSTGQGE